MIKGFKLLRARHLKLGRKGEALTCDYLHSNGCKILARNYKYGRDEIDIIALDGRIICFVEVKTRAAPLKSRPSSGLDEGQRRRISRAASHYLARIGNPALPYRFDLAEAVFGRLGVKEFRYWQDNFR